MTSAVVGDAGLLARRDFYAAGRPAMLREVMQVLTAGGVDSRRVRFDSFDVG